MTTSLGKKFVAGILWSVSGRIGFLVVGFMGNAIMARLLTPQDFGKMGVVMFFIALGRVLTESGMGGALVRKNNVSENDYSTVFVFNLVISLVTFGLFSLFASAIAHYYNLPDLRWLIITSSLVLLIDAFMITYNIRLTRELKYKRKSAYDIASVTVSSAVGISLAYSGFQVWSIVWLQITSSFTLLLLYLIFEPRIERGTFDFQSFKQMFAFGANTTAASILNTVFDNVYQLILGKYYTVTQTGLYFQAKKLEQVPVGLIRSTTLGVVFSALSKLQNNVNVFHSYYIKVVTVFSVLTGAVCGLVFMYSESLIHVIYGEQWTEAAPFMRILSVASFFFMLEMFSRIIFKVFNHTEKILKLEVVKKVIQSLTILVGVLYESIEILLYGILMTNVISYLLNFYVSRNLIGILSWGEVIVTLKVTLILSACIGFMTWSTVQLNLSLHSLLLTIPLFLLAYVILLAVSGTFRVDHALKEINHVRGGK